MEKNIKNANNRAHVHGFINDVRINPVGDSGRTAINLDVVSTESYKLNKDDEEYQTKRTYHDVTIFTDDKKVIGAYEKIQKDCAKNKENRDVDGYKPAVHEVSLEGMLVSKEGSKSIQISCSPENVKVGAKLEENEVRNLAVVSGNVVSIDVYENKKLAVVGVMHHFRPKGAGEEGPDYKTRVDVRINGDRRVGKQAYDDLAGGKIRVGDFVRLSGRMHNTRYSVDVEKDGATVQEERFGVAIDASSFALLKVSKKNAQAEEKAEAPAEEKAKAKTETKKAASKKAASQKTAPKQAPKQTRKTGLKA